MLPLDRRHFLGTVAALPALAAHGAGNKPGEKIILGVIGLNGRGSQLLQGLSALPDVEIAYVCDPDLKVVPAALKKLPPGHKRVPKVVQDMRKIFSDKDVHAVVVATPDH